MDKILSIVIPTYNMESYLDHCLSSLIVSPERMSQLEVLIINDGSKDKSSEIGHNYQNKYPQTFRVIDKENGNYGSCVNRGLKVAKGKYIKILDADDSYDKDGLDHMISLMENVNVDLFISDYNLIKGDHYDYHATFDLTPRTIMSFEEVINKNSIMNIQMHAVAYNLSIFKRIEYHQTEGISYTDQEWIFLPLSICESVYYDDEVVYLYNIGREGQTMDRKVMAKKMPQLIQVTNSLICTYEKESSRLNEAANRYLHHKVKESVIDRYRQCLITYKKGISDSIICSFDKELKTHAPLIYEEMYHVTLLSPLDYHFIREWRSGGGLIYSIFVYLFNILNNVRHLLKQ